MNLTHLLDVVTGQIQGVEVGECVIHWIDMVIQVPIQTIVFSVSPNMQGRDDVGPKKTAMDCDDKSRIVSMAEPHICSYVSLKISIVDRNFWVILPERKGLA